MNKIKSKTEIAILLVILIIYLIALFKLTLFRGANSGARSVNVIPFATIREYYQSILGGNRTTGILNILGNFILLFPLGYLSAQLFPVMRKLTRILMLTFAVSLGIEVFQYILACGSTDIDDLILNTLGGAAGYCVYLLASRLLVPLKFAYCLGTFVIGCACIGFFAGNNSPGNLPGLARAQTRNLSQPLARERRPDAPLFTDTATYPDFSSSPITTAQSNTVDAAWSLILVNKWNYIPDDYEVELIELTNGQSVDIRIYQALQEMFNAARSAGVYPLVVSGYRTAEDQQRLMTAKINECREQGYSIKEATNLAQAWVAIPQTSEHQLGIAVDINGDGVNSADAEVYQWLDQNAYKFGFVRRYPPDKTEITGVINEPWHYRYVGVKAAAEMQNQGLCLEEYIKDR